MRSEIINESTSINYHRSERERTSKPPAVSLPAMMMISRKLKWMLGANQLIRRSVSHTIQPVFVTHLTLPSSVDSRMTLTRHRVTPPESEIKKSSEFFGSNFTFHFASSTWCYLYADFSPPANFLPWIFTAQLHMQWRVCVCVFLFHGDDGNCFNLKIFIERE